MKREKVELISKTDFHNAGGIIIMWDDDRQTLSPTQKRRIRKHFCGVSECTCFAWKDIIIKGGLLDQNEKLHEQMEP